jgi:hypothetical protein
MRRLVLACLLVAGCKSMGHVGSGFGHVASGFEHAAGHVAGDFGHVMRPVLSGASKAAPAIGRSVAKVGEAALEAGEVVGEAALASHPVVIGDQGQEYTPDPDVAPAAGDLCLDCPDEGNCASCPDVRDVP